MKRKVSAVLSSSVNFVPKLFWGVVLLCLSMSSAYSATVTISQNTTILAGDTSLDGSDLIVDGATLTINGTHSFESISLINSAVINHDGRASEKLVLNVNTSFEIRSNSRVELSGLGLGYAADAGYQTGGSHGGRGGFWEANESASEAGSFSQPASFGLGGRGRDTNDTVNYGGGAVKIVAGSLIVDGYIQSNGFNTHSYTGGGSGGSIWVDVGTLSGSGRIYANGANGRSYASGGGGGRIALYYDTNNGFNLSNLSAKGGSGAHTGNKHGGVGSIYLVDRSTENQVLLYQGQSSSTAYQPTTIDVSGDLTTLNIKTAHVQFPEEQVLGGIEVNTDNSRVSLTPELEVQGAILNLHNSSILSYTDLATIESPKRFNKLVLTEYSSIEAPRAESSASQILKLSANEISIDSTSRIDVSGLGLGYSSEAGFQTGGSHGGRGGFWEANESASETGSFSQPASFGLGGRGRETNDTVNYGGGAVKIVADSLIVDGYIQSNGFNTHSYTGGGSGGSIWVDVGTLSGSGRIYANGANGRSYGSGGGGGRIALYYDTNNGFNLVNLSAKGGSGAHTGNKHGGVGSIYLVDRSTEKQVLLYQGQSSSTAYQPTTIDVSGDLTTLNIKTAHVQFPEEQVLGGIEVNTDNSRVSLTPELEVQGATLNLHNNSILSYTDLATIESPKRFNKLVLTQYSSIEAPRAESSASQILKLSANEISIDSTSRIDVSGLGLGYSSEAGYQTGGSYGGRGGFWEANESTSETGSFSQPTSFGVGGRGGEVNGSVNYGGGAVKIIADTLHLEGLIQANGSNINTYTGGGSGGSIWLDVGTLSGTSGGRIHADGASARSYASGGGGGRIALYYDSYTGFNLSNVSAKGGTGAHTGSKYGGAGSIYLVDRKFSNKTLLYKGQSKSVTNQSTLIDVDGDFKKLKIETANVHFPSGGTLAEVEVYGNDARISLPSELKIRAASLELDNSSILTVSNLTKEKPDQIWKNILIDGYSTISHEASADSALFGIDWVAESLRIEAGSSLDVTSSGVQYKEGTGVQAGGSYGGKGGYFTESEAALDTFGQEITPTDFGLGGRGQADNGSRGGGKIKLIVDDLYVSGSIKANGEKPSTGYIGGGSGGSVWITTNKINGAGVIQANGGAARSYGAGGGGGRVAIRYENNSGFNLSKVTATGGAGTHGGTSGENGSVYLDQALSPLRVVGSSPDNGQLLTESIAYVDVTFHGAVDSTSMGIDDVLLASSFGSSTFSSVEQLSSTDYRFHLNAPLTQSGRYRLEVGPNILSQSGASMDQDGDSIPGEALEDAYVITFDLEFVDEIIESDLVIDPSDTQYQDKRLLVRDAVVTVSGSYSFKDVRLTGNAKITLPAAVDQTSAVSTLSFDRLTIDPQSMIDVSGLGLPPSDLVVGLAAGSYGGSGSVDVSDGSAQTNPVFGDQYKPSSYGIGGNGQSSAVSIGGGALKLIANQLQLDGSILADGGLAPFNTAGASGGSLWIEAGDISGQGVISAAGSQGDNIDAHGGGGRVALYYKTLSDFDVASQLIADGAYQESVAKGSVYSSRIEAPTAVKSISISEFTNDDISDVSIEFINEIDPTTFSLDDIRLKDESGTELSLQTIQQLTAVTFSLALSEELLDGTYTLEVGPYINTSSGDGMDQNGNGVSGEDTDKFVFVFTVDRVAPLSTSITSHSVLQTSYVASRLVTLSGSRFEASSIWINGEEAISFGEFDWTLTDYPLEDGINQLNVVTRDLAGNASETLNLTVISDIDTPLITSVVPTDHSNSQTSKVELQYQEMYLDESLIEFDVKRFGISVSGDTTLDTATSVITFESSSDLAEGDYQLEVSLSDLSGNTTGTQVFNFTLDFTKPSSLVINAHPTSVNTPYFNFTGLGLSSEEPNLWVGGSKVISQEQSAWSHQVNLVPGLNVFKFQSQDLAGNLSDEIVASITFDDTAPDSPVLAINSQGNGTQVTLDWQNYDEVANGDDIASYEVYQSTISFTDKASAQLVSTLAASQKSYVANGLTRGQTYYFAIAAVDSTGNSSNSLNASQAIPEDTIAPATVKGIKANSSADAVSLEWNANTEDDFNHYRIYVDGQLSLDNIPTTILSHTFTDWVQAENHQVALSAVDASGNESTKVTKTLVTWLPNPTLIAAESHSGKVDLSWVNSHTSLTNSHLLFVSEAEFSDVSGMQPKLSISRNASKAGVAGLTNGQAYYFAVVAENLNGGFNPLVSTISATPEADSTGPVINSLDYGENDLLVTSMLVEQAHFVVTASDPSGVSYVEFYIDEQLIGTSYGSRSGFSQAWDLLSVADGQYQLKVKVFDTVDNVTEQVATLNVQLAAPAAPTLVPPVKSVTNRSSFSIAVNASSNTEILAVVNGAEQGDWQSIDSISAQLPVTLSEGANSIQAKVRYQGRITESALSNELTISLDTSLPEQPSSLTALSKVDGRIALSWNKPNDENVKGFNIYRSTQAIDESLVGAEKLNAELYLYTSYEDLLDIDGQYFYRVVAVNDADSESLPSPQASALADSLGPVAESIIYTPNGYYDETNRVFGRGTVDVAIRFNELLRNDPFFAMTPEGGTPTSVALTKDYNDDQLYHGSFEVTETMLTGNVWAVLSAHDEIGNRGSDVSEGQFIKVDSQGPEVVNLQLNPGSPIDNEGTPQLTVVVDTNDQLAEGSTPLLVPEISSSNGYQAVPAFESGIPLTLMNSTASGQTWQGHFNLPADAGLDDNGQPTVESLKFSYQAKDALNNESSRVRVDNYFQIYQGDLPPLATPSQLYAKALPAAQIELGWQPVEYAIAYVLYRKASDEQALTEFKRIDSDNGVLATSWIDGVDTSLAEGLFEYAIASVRLHNGEESISAKSDVVTVVSDSTAPNKPTNLVLTLAGNGIAAQWQAPSGETQSSQLRYDLYRLPIAQGEAVELTGVEPIQANLKDTNTLDSTPSEDAHTYVVVAKDAAGNSSEPSDAVYLNFDLLPVAELEVELIEDQKPIIRWLHKGSSVQGFDLYIGEQGSEQKLNTSLLTQSQWQDDVYPTLEKGGAQQQTTYSVIAEDNNGAKSAARYLTLPALSANLSDNNELTSDGQLLLKRGVMNRVVYRVDNQGASEAKSVRLIVTIQVDQNTWEHVSAYVNVPAQSFVDVPVVIGGYSDLTSTVEITSRIEQIPSPGEKISIIQKQNALVAEDAFLIELETKDFTKGGTGQVKFSLRNHTGVEVELLTAQGNGKEASDEVRFVIEDLDGNILLKQPLQLVTGNVINTAGGSTVARVLAGETYESSWIELPVSVSTHDAVRVRMEVDQFRYHTGRSDQVSISGTQSSTLANMAETPYFATLTVNVQGEEVSTDPTVVPRIFPEEIIELRGQAINRQTSEAVPFVSVKLVFNVRGFDLEADVTTDSEGNFIYEYLGTKQNTGLHTVSAVHPYVLEKPNMAEFSVFGADISPGLMNAHLPYNYPGLVPFTVKAGSGSTLTNTRFELVLDEGESIEDGLQVTLPTPISLTSQQEGVMQVGLAATNQVSEQGQLNFHVLVDESSSPIALITLNYKFSEAAPSLVAELAYLETGVSRGESITETVVLKNQGLSDISDLVLSLQTTDQQTAPSWAYISSDVSPGALTVGEDLSVDLSFNPTESVTEAIYEFRLVAESEVNSLRFEHPVYVAVTQSGEGSIAFHVSDIYTATLDENNEPIPGLAGAKIKLQNELVLTEVYEATTNEYGEALFENIPAGRYIYRAVAFDHNSVSERVWVRAGVTSSESVFLPNQLISVEFSVKEIVLEDRYEIKLEATYETHVPAPVVIVEPMAVNLPMMKKGEIYQGELTYTNYGLIRAINVEETLPEGDNFARFEYMAQLPDSIEAGEVVVIPYRIQALQDFDNSSLEIGSGGGCGGRDYSGQVYYEGVCAGGDSISGNASTSWNANAGSGGSGGSCSLGGSGGGGGNYSGGGSNSNSGGGGRSYSTTSSAGGGCGDDDDDNEDDCK